MLLIKFQLKMPHYLLHLPLNYLLEQLEQEHLLVNSHLQYKSVDCGGDDACILTLPY